MAGIYDCYGNQQLNGWGSQPSYATNAQNTAMQNGYNSNFNQAMMPPKSTSMSYIAGRGVQNENEIVPNEVPMNGEYGFFVQNDLTKIYAKTWGRDGGIHTKVFELVLDDDEVVVKPSNQNEESNDSINLILERLDRIEKSLKKQANRYYSKNNRKDGNNE